MGRIDKENYYSGHRPDSGRALHLPAPVLWGPFSSRATRSSPPATTAPPRGRRNCVDLNSLHPRGRWEHPLRGAVRAVPLRPRRGQRPSSPPPAARPWAPPSTWPAWSRTPGAADSRLHPPAPCAAASSSTPASPGWSSETPARSTGWWRWPTGCGRTTPCPDPLEAQGRRN